MMGLRSRTRRPYASWFTGAVARSALIAVVAVLWLAGCGSEAREDGAASAALDRALIAAAYDNDLATARSLIGRGADVNTKDATQQSPYLIATSEVGDDPRLLEMTLRAGARVDARDAYDGTGLIRAAERGYPRIVRRLLRTSIDVDHVNRLGWTALLEAIVLGEGGPRHVRTVRALVDGGVDVNTPDADGVTPLAHAEDRRYDAIARILRAAGARRSR
jgi:uncharacterized protein